MKYAAMTKYEAQRRRWTFYEAVKLQPGNFLLTVTKKAI